jgi:hypothetical protein
MLFYSTIFIVSLIVAVVLLWFYRASTNTSKQSTHNATQSSLNDAPSADPASIRSQNVGWPYREEKMRTGGKVYKTTRKVPTVKKTDLKTLNKPWGW